MYINLKLSVYSFSTKTFFGDLATNSKGMTPRKPLWKKTYFKTIFGQLCYFADIFGIYLARWVESTSVQSWYCLLAQLYLLLGIVD